MKKIIFILLLALIMPTMPTHAATSFSDVKETDWFYTDVTKLYEYGIIEGFDDGSFKPNQPLLADEFIKMLVRTVAPNIKDAEDYWATYFIDYAEGRNWLSSLDLTEYSVEINRYDSALLVANYLDDFKDFPDNINEYSPFYTDYNKIPSTYQLPVLKSLYYGIIIGYSNDTFQGDNVLTRAQGAAIIHRIIDPNYSLEPLRVEEVDTILDIFNDFEYLYQRADLDNSLNIRQNKLKIKNDNLYIPIQDTAIPVSLISEVEHIIYSTVVYDYNTTSMDDYNYELGSTTNGITITYRNSENTLLFRIEFVPVNDNMYLTIDPRAISSRDFDAYYSGLLSAVLEEYSSYNSDEVHNFISLTLDELIDNPKAVMNFTANFDSFDVVLVKEEFEKATFTIIPQ